MTVFLFIIQDVKENMTAIIGLDLVSFCTGNGGDNDIVSYQEILKDDGQDTPRNNQLIKDENVKVTVWPFVSTSCISYLEK